MSQGPTFLKRHVGEELKKLRVAAGKSRKDAADKLDCSLSKITKIERGYNAVKRAELDDLLTLYNADAEIAESLLRIASESKQRGWWSSYGQAVPDWFRTFVGLEYAAEEIQKYTEIIPGLLQVEPYTRAAIAAVSPDLSEVEVENRLKVRAERQARLLGMDPPRLNFVLGEAAIQRLVGGPKVMLQQLQFLLDIQQTKPVEIRILDNDAGAHAALGFTFTLLRHPDELDAGTVYVEGLTRADYFDQRTDPLDVDLYRLAFARVRDAALSVQKSRDLLARVVVDLQERAKGGT